jgi:hypothetical protein
MSLQSQREGGKLRKAKARANERVMLRERLRWRSRVLLRPRPKSLPMSSVTTVRTKDIGKGVALST